MKWTIKINIEREVEGEFEHEEDVVEAFWGRLAMGNETASTIMSDNMEVIKEGTRDEFRQCGDCVHKMKRDYSGEAFPSPCNSCDQDMPTNFTEEE